MMVPRTGQPETWALVVDDHPLFCDALVLTLRAVANYAQVRTADSLAAALAVVADHGVPDMLILDLNLPDVSGLDGLLRLKAKTDGAPIIVVSSLADDRVIDGALSSGAAGYVPKHSPRGVIREALTAVREGRTYLPDGFTAPQGGPDLVAAGQRLASLTNQQRRILSLICEGKLNKQIAFELSIAETTVKAHMTAIMRKLRVQSRTQAVLVARQAHFGDSLPNGG